MTDCLTVVIHRELLTSEHYRLIDRRALWIWIFLKSSILFKQTTVLSSVLSLLVDSFLVDSRRLLKDGNAYDDATATASSPATMWKLRCSAPDSGPSPMVKELFSLNGANSNDDRRASRRIQISPVSRAVLSPLSCARRLPVPPDSSAPSPFAVIPASPLAVRPSCLSQGTSGATCGSTIRTAAPRPRGSRWNACAPVSQPTD